MGILKQQLILKGIITESDWVELFHNRVRIDYYKDNHDAELKDAEVMRERLGIMDQATSYVGEYLSKEWVMKNILRFDDMETAEITKQMYKELEGGDIPVPPPMEDPPTPPPNANLPEPEEEEPDPDRQAAQPPQ